MRVREKTGYKTCILGSISVREWGLGDTGNTLAFSGKKGYVGKSTNKVLTAA